jgi:hypothetical protein
MSQPTLQLLLNLLIPISHGLVAIAYWFMACIDWSENCFELSTDSNYVVSAYFVLASQIESNDNYLRN